MTFSPPSGRETLEPPNVSSLFHRPLSPPRLDRNRLLLAIQSRRQRLEDLEVALVDGCEAEASSAARGGIRTNDPDTWNTSEWNRYLAAALRLEPVFAPEMRRLAREIDQLTRLCDLPVAVERKKGGRHTHLATPADVGLAYEGRST